MRKCGGFGVPEESPLVVVVVHTGPKAAAVVVVQTAQGSSGCGGPHQGQVSRVVVVLTRLRAAAVGWSSLESGQQGELCTAQCRIKDMRKSKTCSCYTNQSL